MLSLPLLSLLIWIPIVTGALVICACSDRSPGRARWLAIAGALVGCIPVILLVARFQDRLVVMQFVEYVRWLPSFGVAWHVGVDGISLWLVALTPLTTVVVVVASWRSITVKVSQYYAALLVLSGLMQGIFSSLDGMLFFVFFEATLIPFYLLIGTWGHINRAHAAIKFFLFSLLGSLMMLVAMLYLHSQSHNFDIEQWSKLKLGFLPQILTFLAFLAAFSVKVPMWPVHTWLPDVHLNGPTGAVVMLGMLKLGGYGLMRFVLPITPEASRFFAPGMIFLALVAVIYSSLVALVQTDMRKLLAYSTIGHMGLVTLGLFTFNALGIEGALVQMMSYGLVSGAMLVCAGMLRDRTQSGAIDTYGGVANTMPRFAAFAMLFSMANLGLPGTCGFVGEFMVLMGTIRLSFWIGALAALTSILSASYTLWMYKRVFFGAIANARVANLVDLDKREFGLLAAMAALVLLIGVVPRPFTDAIDLSAGNLLRQAQRTTTPAGADAQGIVTKVLASVVLRAED